MKFRFLDFLACPYCGSSFRCDVHNKMRVDIPKISNLPTCRFWCSLKNTSLLRNNTLDCRGCLENEVIEGILKCACGRSYPITNGVPRILTTSLSLIKKKTATKFGYEWTKFSDYNVDNFAIFLKFLKPNFFSGKIGLDVGCGAGRHLLQVSGLGAEVVGFDLSSAVDVAYQRVFRLPNVHLVQCDVYSLPFRKDTFDFVYSLGVIHHLPNPEKGFRELIPLLKPENGTIFFLVYQRSFRKILLEPVRRVTTNLPEKFVYLLSFVFAIFDYGLLCQCYRLSKKIPLLKKAVDWITPLRIKEYSQYDFKVSFTDWFDRFSAPISHFYNLEEIEKWLERSPLVNTNVSKVDVSWIYGYGVRKRI